MRSLVVLADDRPCAPCEPTMPLCAAISRTSWPNEMPLCAAISGTSDKGVMPGWVLISSR